MALFFVDSQYQRRDIRKLLLQAVFDHSVSDEITVSFILKMTMKLLLIRGFGSVCSWRLSGGSGIWRSMGLSPILIIQRIIRLLRKSSVGNAIRFLPVKGGGAVPG